jgi:hypothetical protein
MVSDRVNDTKTFEINDISKNFILEIWNNLKIIVKII